MSKTECEYALQYLQVVRQQLLITYAVLWTLITTRFGFLKWSFFIVSNTSLLLKCNGDELSLFTESTELFGRLVPAKLSMRSSSQMKCNGLFTAQVPVYSGFVRLEIEST